MRRSSSCRHAGTIVEWCVVAALIILVIVASVALVGNWTNAKLNETASDLTNPASLKARFGSGSPSFSPSPDSNGN